MVGLVLVAVAGGFDLVQVLGLRFFDFVDFAAQFLGPEEFDDLAQHDGEAGQREDAEADGDHQLDQPSVGQTGRRSGDLASGVGALDEVDAVVNDQCAVGDEEQQAAGELDPPLAPLTEVLAHKVDMELLIRVSEGLDRVITKIGKFAAWAGLGLILVTIFDVVTRRFFVLGSTKLQEAEWHLHVILFALCLGYAYMKDLR